MSNTSQIWKVSEHGFSRQNTEKNGNKFLLGNGYIGLRGVLEEYGKNELAACTLNGVYDKSGDQWREPVNTPYPFNLELYVNGKLLKPDTSQPIEHSQTLDIAHAIHSRQTTYPLPNGESITLEVSRFLSIANAHLGAMSIRICSTSPCDCIIKSNISQDIWDINGPHIKEFATLQCHSCLCLQGTTIEKNIPIAVATDIAISKGLSLETDSSLTTHTIRFTSKANQSHEIHKYIAVCTGLDSENPTATTMTLASNAKAEGFESILSAHKKLWTAHWANSDVVIEGDDEAQLNLKYSIYHLLITAPARDGQSIPARGLSGQVYKGAIFWDTEIFMLPFFNHTQPELARRLVDYRFRTLDGARRKAADYGYRGAFYAWESQETGDDACTYFNVTDVITGRPMRTYFRDKQIHISADVAHAIWHCYEQSGNADILIEGGAEVILECARFFYSYAHYKPERQRYELHDVVGPDEYHERVNNNAFTNAMVKHTMRIALEVSELLASEHPATWAKLIDKIALGEELIRFADFEEKLYQPQPASDTHVIEQFDGYHRLEDTIPGKLKNRLINPNEYWGGGNGIATTTKVLKQADVVLMLHLFSDEYSSEVKLANWEYYEPRTEHGSSLSPCVYALLAAELGKTEWAYRYFLRTASIDLTGKSKQYVGDLYIGGTHPAANGGAWMATILGFAGLRTGSKAVALNPQLPEQWTCLQFRFCYRHQWHQVILKPNAIRITADDSNTCSTEFIIFGEHYSCSRHKDIVINQDKIFA